MATDDRIRLLVSIPTEAVGYMIGKSGKTLNEISEQSRAKLFLQCHQDIESNAKERAILVEGSFTHASEALRRLLAKLAARNDAAQGGVTIQKWAITRVLCGVLIGRGGEGIKAIHASTGAWVKVAHVEETSPGDSERLVYIRGTAEQIAAALEIVKKMVGGRPCNDTVVNKLGIKASCQLPLKSIHLFQSFLDQVRAMKGTAVFDPAYDVKVNGTIMVSVDLDQAVVDNIFREIFREKVSSDNENWMCVKLLFANDIFNFVANHIVENSQDNRSMRLLDFLKETYETNVFYGETTSHQFSRSKSILSQVVFLAPESKIFNALLYFYQCVISRGMSIEVLSPELPIQKGSDKNNREQNNNNNIAAGKVDLQMSNVVSNGRGGHMNFASSNQVPYVVLDNQSRTAQYPTSFYGTNVETMRYQTGVNRYFMPNTIVSGSQQMYYIPTEAALYSPSVSHAMQPTLVHGYNMSSSYGNKPVVIGESFGHSITIPDSNFSVNRGNIMYPSYVAGTHNPSAMIGVESHRRDRNVDTTAQLGSITNGMSIMHLSNGKIN